MTTDGAVFHSYGEPRSFRRQYLDISSKFYIIQLLIARLCERLARSSLTELPLCRSATVAAPLRRPFRPSGANLGESSTQVVAAARPQFATTLPLRALRAALRTLCWKNAVSKQRAALPVSCP